MIGEILFSEALAVLPRAVGAIPGGSPGHRGALGSLKWGAARPWQGFQTR